MSEHENARSWFMKGANPYGGFFFNEKEMERRFEELWSNEMEEINRKYKELLEKSKEVLKQLEGSENATS